MAKVVSKWATVVPPLVAIILVATWGRSLPLFIVLGVAVALGAAVLTAVHHAEVVAARVGEPYGSLVLAVAVTVIEVGLIVSLMASGKAGSESLARDTVFAAIMITTNGIVGISLLVGTFRRSVVRFSADGTSGALAALTALTTLSLVLPTFTASSPGPTFSTGQLAFAAVVSLALYGTYVFVQTVRNREYFLPVGTSGKAVATRRQPSDRDVWASLGLLVICLVSVVGLAKVISPSIEDAVQSLGAPQAVVGVVIAALVLLPETLAAVRAARHNRLQTSMNLAYGSALASIGLTIPAIAVATIWLPGQLLLGLAPTEIILFALTVGVSAFTVNTGRATLLQGGVHIVLFASFLFLAFSP
ncbi:MAG: ionic transporter y4hA [Actinomycetes bacterium]